MSVMGIFQKRSILSAVAGFACLMFASGITWGQVVSKQSIASKAVNKLISSKIQALVYKKTSPNNAKSYALVQFDSNAGSPANNVTRTITKLTSPMCLSKEEVRGQRIESEIAILDGGSATQLLPGMVLDADSLLNSGEFVYQNMAARKAYTVSTSSNLAKTSNATVGLSRGKPGIDEAQARAAIQSLCKPANFKSMPNVGSVQELDVATFQESMALNISGSAFYMGISASDQFAFSSEKYRYMYAYTFEQTFLPVIASTISSPADLYSDKTAFNPQWLYVREVKYGRRLYVLLESEYDLEKYENEFNGSVQWGVVSGAFSQKNKGETFRSKTNLRIVTQGGQAVQVSDPAKIQQAIDNYFKSSYSENDIVPLSYKLSDMNGKPVSLVTKAFLDGNSCLSKNKFRIRLKEIRVNKADDDADDNSEQLYGGVSVFLRDVDNKVVHPDGKTPLPSLPNVTVPTGSIKIGSEDAPYRISEGATKSKTFEVNEQGKYVDVTIHNLDCSIEVKPWLKEEDDLGDDDFVTDNKLKRTLRKMLMEGSTSDKFNFRHDKSDVDLMIEIIPLQ